MYLLVVGFACVAPLRLLGRRTSLHGIVVTAFPIVLVGQEGSALGGRGIYQKRITVAVLRMPACIAFFSSMRAEHGGRGGRGSEGP